MPTVIPWAKTSTSPAAAPARASTASTAAITPRDWSSGRGRHLRGVEPLAVEEDGVGEGPADVDPEQHADATEVRSRARLSRRVVAVGADDDVDRRRASGSRPGKSARRWPPRDSRRSRAQARSPRASG